jgi:hypothetical protein
MRALAGGAHISFEGDLSRCRGLFGLPGAATEEMEALRRQTLYPVQEFIILPLEPETIRPILAEVLPEGRVVRNITHVQIERAGRLAFGAYDNFHRDCVVCWPAVSRELLEQMRVSGVLRSWEPAPAEAHRWHD